MVSKPNYRKQPSLPQRRPLKDRYR